MRATQKKKISNVAVLHASLLFNCIGEEIAKKD